MKQTVTSLCPGDSARIIAHHATGAVRQRLLDLGLLPGQTVTLVRAAPLGDPLQLRIGQTEVAIRIAEATTIRVEHLEHRNKPE